ncbi:hypothetical protein CHS0354_038879, partial [Potamilus streckersoni]
GNFYLEAVEYVWLGVKREGEGKPNGSIIIGKPGDPPHNNVSAITVDPIPIEKGRPASLRHAAAVNNQPDLAMSVVTDP